MRTNSSRCSSVALVLFLALSLAAPTAAVSVGETDVPDEASVGSQVTATVTLTELYRNPQLEEWRLVGATELTNVTWVVSYVDQTGAKTGQEEFTGQNVSGATVRASDGVSEVRVRITGTVPEVDSYRYDPPQQFLLMSLTQSRQGGASNEIDSWRVHYYTSDSREARNALDEANASIQGATSAGANADTARNSFDSAVDAFENGNFDNARQLANRAGEEANSARQSSQTRQTLLYAGVGVVVLIALVGGVLYWRSQQESYDKLG